MKTITAVAAKKLGKFIAKDFREIFGSSYNHVAERLGSLDSSSISRSGESSGARSGYFFPAPSQYFLRPPACFPRFHFFCVPLDGEFYSVREARLAWLTHFGRHPSGISATISCRPARVRSHAP